MFKISVVDDRKIAREKLKGICGVYRICDGDQVDFAKGKVMEENYVLVVLV